MVAQGDSSIGKEDANVHVSWGEAAGAVNGYEIHRSANDPYFIPQSTTLHDQVASDQTNYTDVGAIGSVLDNYVYVIRALGCGDSHSDSNRVGEFDFNIVPGGS